MPDDQTAEVQETEAIETETETVEAADVAASEETETGTQDDRREYSAKYVKGLRDEAASWRKKLRDLEATVSGLKDRAAKADELEQEQMTDDERKAAELKTANDRAAELEAQLQAAASAMRETQTNSALLRALTRPDAGVADPDAAMKLLDRSLLDYDDDGNLVADSVIKAIEAALDAYPILQATKQAKTGAAANPRRTEVDVAEQPDAQRDRIFGHNRQVHPFDPKYAATKGGGVLWTNEIDLPGR